MGNRIRQHQHLRVPNGWEGQDRALIVQLERILDELYNLSGQLEGAMVTNVAYDPSTKQLTMTIDGKTDDITSVATLDQTGKIPANLLPSYVDDVEEYADMAHFPATGEEDKIYVAKDTGFTYRWSGTQYVRLNTYDPATQSSSGLMSAADKTKLDGIESGAQVNPSVSDNNPTLSWGTKSKVGSVGNTDLHVTMPSNPDTWRPVQDNLTSTSTTDSLSAKQGKVLNDGKVAKAGDTMTGTLKGFSTAGDTGSNETGAVLLCPGQTSRTGIFNGNGDGTGFKGVANMIFKSWYSIGFVDGCTGQGMTAAVNCRTGGFKGSNFTSANYNLETVGAALPNKLNYGEYLNPDMNTITTAGQYGIQGGSATNLPDGLPAGAKYGVLFVGEYRRSGNNYYTQLYFSHGGDSNTNYGVYFRQSTANAASWGAWQRLDSSKNQSWGTSLYVPSSHAFVIIDYTLQFQIWCSSTAGIDVSTRVYDPDVDQFFDRRYTTNTNTLSFSPYYPASQQPTTKPYTITRSGTTSFTITSTGSHSMKAFY